MNNIARWVLSFYLHVLLFLLMNHLLSLLDFNCLFFSFHFSPSFLLFPMLSLLFLSFTSLHYTSLHLSSLFLSSLFLSFASQCSRCGWLQPFCPPVRHTGQGVSTITHTHRCSYSLSYLRSYHHTILYS
jgi:hypothetical protein